MVRSQLFLCVSLGEIILHGFGRLQGLMKWCLHCETDRGRGRERKRKREGEVERERERERETEKECRDRGGCGERAQN